MACASDNGSKPRRLAGPLFFLLLGPIVWAAQLGIVYSGHAVSCDKIARPLVATAFPPGVGLLTGFALALLIAALAMARRPGRGGDPDTRFMPYVMTKLALLSAYGVVAMSLGPLLIAACAPLR